MNGIAEDVGLVDQGIRRDDHFANVKSYARNPHSQSVAQAAKKGLKLSENYVYTIRSASSASKAKKAAKPGRKLGASSGMSAAEAQLRDAIADLGVGRCDSNSGVGQGHDSRPVVCRLLNLVASPTCRRI